MARSSGSRCCSNFCSASKATGCGSANSRSAASASRMLRPASARVDAERSYFHRALRAIPPPLPPVKINDAATARGSNASRRCRRPVSTPGGCAVSVAIVDYGSGNLHSAHKAFERAAREAGIDAEIKVTGDPEAVARAERIVLPGVGAFADCRRGLEAVPGMIDALDRARARARPALPRHLRRHATDGGRADSNTRPPKASAGSAAMSPRSSPAAILKSRTWAGTRSLPDGASAARRTFRPDRMGCTLISSIPSPLRTCRRMKSSRSPIMAARSSPSSATTISSGRNSIPRRARRLGLALIANFLRWQP